MSKEVSSQLLQILKNTFKFNSFRTGQLEAITLLLNKNNLLVIKPTGYGKSLLYQVPSVYMGGITLVLSPLLALIRDQIIQLQDRFGINAATLNSDQTLDQNNEIKRKLKKQDISILFITPEQLEKRDQLSFIQSLPINLLVIDEAHCISTWGHDFRPSYRQIKKLIEGLTSKNKKIKVLALTATANETTEQDIIDQVGLKKMAVYRESMDRPNLQLSVLHVHGLSNKLALLFNTIKVLKGCGIVYCATRDNTEIVSQFLKSKKIKAEAYHAGLSAEIKLHIQKLFSQDNEIIIAATNALGMGIDKSNIRYVIHFDLPGSLTAYYQEVGRAGRDGQLAQGILFYDVSDLRIQHYFIQSSQPTVIEKLTQKRKDLSEMQNYAEQKSTCLMQILRQALGDKKVNDCHKCNVCSKPSCDVTIDKDVSTLISLWLTYRVVPFMLSYSGVHFEGIAILNGKIYKNDWLAFQSQREKIENLFFGIPKKLLSLVKECILSLNQSFKFKAIVALPTCNWRNREKFCEMLANILKIPLFLLTTEDVTKMEFSKQFHKITGSLLVIDDYIKSGNTATKMLCTLKGLFQSKQKFYFLALAAHPEAEISWRSTS